MKANIERGNELKEMFGLFKSVEQAIEANLIEEDYFNYAVACDKEVEENMTKWTLTSARDWALSDASEYADKASEKLYS